MSNFLLFSIGFFAGLILRDREAKMEKDRSRNGGS